MKIVLLTNSVSVHQIPLAREIRMRIKDDEFLYVYTEEYIQCGLQEIKSQEPWISTDLSECNECEVLLVGGVRPIDLIENRARQGLITYYQSERWFKPFHGLPGWVRMLVPSYRKMAKRFVRWANSDSNARVLAIGPWAKKDFLRIGIKEEKIIDWGYYVAPSVQQGKKLEVRGKSNGKLRVLWVGRMIGWKRVDTIIRAIARIAKLEKAVGVGQRREISLTLVGDGPEKAKLMKLAEKVNSTSTSPIITFLPRQPIEKVREIMREHDVYVLASDESEGWGAVLNEALEEGMNILGTHEAGASAAILPKERLYHAGDAKALAKLIEKECINELPPCSIGEWTAEKAAEKLMTLCGF